jgi:hypothetical protein
MTVGWLRTYRPMRLGSERGLSPRRQKLTIFVVLGRAFLVEVVIHQKPDRFESAVYLGEQAYDDPSDDGKAYSCLGRSASSQTKTPPRTAINNWSCVAFRSFAISWIPLGAAAATLAWKVRIMR